MTEDRLYTLEEANAELPDLRQRLPRLRVARDGEEYCIAHLPKAEATKPL